MPFDPSRTQALAPGHTYIPPTIKWRQAKPHNSYPNAWDAFILSAGTSSPAGPRVLQCHTSACFLSPLPKNSAVKKQQVLHGAGPGFI